MRIAALSLLALTSCFGGGHFMSPGEAYDVESRACTTKARGDHELSRRCQALVDHKYAQYAAEGDYPAPPR